MERIKKIIGRSLRAWRRAKPNLEEKARKLYEQLAEVLERNPDVAGRTVTELLKIYRLLLEQRFEEAFGYLCLLLTSLLLHVRKSRKQKK